MASNLIINFLQRRGIRNINRIEFIKHGNNLNAGSVNEIAVVKFNNERRKDLHLFLKVCKKGSFAFTLNTELFTFAREQLFYDVLLPSLVDFQYERMLSGVTSYQTVDYLCFECIGFGKVEENDYVIMERFCDRLYYVTRANEFHNNDQICCTLRGIASFHAVSYCKKMIKNFDFLEEYPLLEEKLFTRNCLKEITSVFVENFKTNLKILQAVVNEMNSDSSTKYIFQTTQCAKLNQIDLERLESISDNFLDIFRKLIDPTEECATLCHGDFHMGNIAYNKQDNRKVKFFDFQAIRFASPLTDVQQYFALVTSPKTREEHVTRYLRIYSKAFKTCCDELGLSDDLNVFDLDFIIAEYKRTAPIGFLFGFIFNMSRLLSRDVYTRLQLATSDDEIMNIIANDDQLLNVIEMYVDLLVEVDTNGVLDDMERLVIEP